jgi:hypothetical protein
VRHWAWTRVMRVAACQTPTATLHQSHRCVRNCCMQPAPAAMSSAVGYGCLSHSLLFGHGLAWATPVCEV